MHKFIAQQYKNPLTPIATTEAEAEAEARHRVSSTDTPPTQLAQYAQPASGTTSCATHREPGSKGGHREPAQVLSRVSSSGGSQETTPADCFKTITIDGNPDGTPIPEEAFIFRGPNDFSVERVMLVEDSLSNRSAARMAMWPFKNLEPDPKKQVMTMIKEVKKLDAAHCAEASKQGKSPLDLPYGVVVNHAYGESNGAIPAAELIGHGFIPGLIFLDMNMGPQGDGELLVLFFELARRLSTYPEHERTEETAGMLLTSLKSELTQDRETQPLSFLETPPASQPYRNIKPSDLQKLTQPLLAFSEQPSFTKPFTRPLIIIQTSQEQCEHLDERFLDFVQDKGWVDGVFLGKFSNTNRVAALGTLPGDAFALPRHSEHQDAEENDSHHDDAQRPANPHPQEPEQHKGSAGSAPSEQAETDPRQLIKVEPLPPAAQSKRAIFTSWVRHNIFRRTDDASSHRQSHADTDHAEILTPVSRFSQMWPFGWADRDPTHQGAYSPNSSRHSGEGDSERHSKPSSKQIGRRQVGIADPDS